MFETQQGTGRRLMTCDWRSCPYEATVALRFGDGLYCSSPGGKPSRQTYARYCPSHSERVRRAFVTCDEQPVSALMAGPAGGGIGMRR